MTEPQPAKTSTPNSGARKPGKATLIARLGFTAIFGIVLPLAILAGGYMLTKYYLDTPPKARRGNNEASKQARLVDVVELQSGNRDVVVSAMGLVNPARQVSLQPLVSGELISVSENLELGGYLRENEPVVTIDPQDFKLVIRQREAAVAQAKSNLAIEMGQQQIARQEFELLGQEIAEGDSDLVLRIPQLESAKAQLESQEASLEDARLDLSRTVVRAPFNAIVLEENTEVGLIVNTNTRLADLVGTDQFWVQVSVPLDDVRWINMPDGEGNGGATARIYDDAAWAPGQFREGQVVRFTNSVSNESRMASLLIEVDDPLSLKPENKGLPPLLLNSYVRAEIQGKTLNDVVVVNRQYVRNGNQIWLKTPENKLEIRDLEIAWKGRDEVYISSGLRGGEYVVTSTLATPVEQMLLRTQDNAPAQIQETPEKNSLILLEADAEESSSSSNQSAPPASASTLPNTRTGG